MTITQIEANIAKLLKSFSQDTFVFEYLFRLYEEMIKAEGTK